MRRNWFAVACLLGIVLIAAGVYRGVTGRQEWTAARYPRIGVTLQHPKAWKVQRLTHHCFRFGPTVVVSDLPELQIPDSCAAAEGLLSSELGNLPAGHVIVNVMAFANPVRPIPAINTRLPLTFDRFTPHQRFPNHWLTHVLHGKADYLLGVWIGPAATPRDREAVERLIRSLSFADPDPQ